MKHSVHRDRLMFRWITKNHEIVVGFKNVKHSKCIICDKSIPLGNNICDECFKQFKKEKHISKK